MMVLMMIEDMLADLGCDSVTSAATVDQALALIAAQKFDVATLDVNLNGSDSYAIADALVAQGVPFAFSTGYGDHGLRNDHRGRPILKKPFGTSDFTRILQELMSEASSSAPPASLEQASGF